MVPAVAIPEGRTTARHWATRIVLDRLFKEWVVEVGASAEWQIGACDSSGGRLPGELRLSDAFFRGAEGPWLATESMPTLPLPTFEPSAFGIHPKVTASTIPVLFGQSTLSGFGTDRIELGIDVFGSAFFMLSRYEEIVVSTKDRLARFPASESVAHKAGFLGRPLIDEYAEILWEVMRMMWPGLARKRTRSQVLPSHDVDEPSRDAFRGLRAVLKESAGDLLKRHRVRRAIQGPWHWLHGQIALHPRDAYNTFDRLMDLSDSQGTKSTFFFMAGESNPAFDRAYRLGHPAIRRLMRRIHDRGHEIGLHPSFETFRDAGLLTQEADRLRDMLRRIGVRQDRLGARMHYLRWSMPETWRAMVRAGLDFDASLGFADMAGFRCGTCHQYRAFDVQAGQPLDLEVRPLIAMDVTVMDEQYMGLGTASQAHDLLCKLRERCESVGGSFSILWHNNEFVRPGSWDLYRHALGANS